MLKIHSGASYKVWGQLPCLPMPRLTGIEGEGWWNWTGYFVELARIVEHWCTIQCASSSYVWRTLQGSESYTSAVSRHNVWCSVHYGNWVRRGTRAQGQISQREQIGVCWKAPIETWDDRKQNVLTISEVPLKPRATLGKGTVIHAKTHRVKVVTMVSQV